MTKLNSFSTWLRTTRDERGANLVEYILLVAFIALLVIGAVFGLRQAVGSKFDGAKSCLNTVNSSTSSC